jgi:hypothetical protein
LIGSASSILLVARSVRMGLDMQPPPIHDVAPTNELERRSRGGQLFSDGKGFFWTMLGRPVEYQPNQDLHE